MKAPITYILFYLLLASIALAQPRAEAKNIAFKADTITVAVLGIHDDSRFEPALVEIRTGDVIRFEVKEGVHTVTAYHPDNRRELGIPKEAESFDSGVLSSGDVWHLKFTVPGEYNYFCLPHERMGHTGKIEVTEEKLSLSAKQ